MIYAYLCLCRRLAEVSRLTRGVVVLICDIHYAKRVMDEAKRLNMLEGHFFWLWIDASRDIDVFHNIGNRTQYVEDSDMDPENSWDKDDAIRHESPERSKREDTDNNLIKNVRERQDKISIERLNNDGINIKNSSLNSFFRRISSNKLEAHSVNNKLLYVNFSKSYDRSRNISSEALRNYNVNNKGVETSKTENDSIEKEKLSFFNINNSRHISFSKMENESFNKYVNSINVDDNNNTEKKTVMERGINNREVKDSILFSSDISDFLMNPTVHTSTIQNVRDTIEKRGDQMFVKEKIIEKSNEDTNNNVTEIFNSLPIGLLALHPQPMKIGES